MSETTPLKTVGDRGNLHNPHPLGTAESWMLTVRFEKDIVRQYSLPELLRLEGEPWSESMNVDCVSSGQIDGGRPVSFGGVRFATLFKDLALGDKLGSIEELHPTVLFKSLAPGGCGPRSEKHWTALPLRDCMDDEQKVMLVTFLGQAPLPYENGGPLRSVVGPRLFFYKGVKWLSEIDVRLGPLDGFRGTWEEYAGYHNRARTAKEERFEPRMRVIKEVRWDENDLPYDVSELVPESEWRKTLEDMIRRKDLSRLIGARLHEMGITLPESYEGFRFTDGDYKAKLRGTRFSSATFCNADLRGVNFSLSYFTRARFSRDGVEAAQLQNCDFEGAHFQHAFLQGVSMEGATLTNTTFTKDFKPAQGRVKGLNVRNTHNLDERTRAWLAANDALV